MGDLVNLRRFRKARAAADQDRQAEANRARYGRTRAEREQANAEADARERRLDGARMDGADFELIEERTQSGDPTD